MSVYIKGLEMPKNKPICIIIDPVGQARRYDLNNDKYADDELFEAVPVPSHGRLGDLDAVEAEIREKTNEQFCVNIVHAAPTIIPAELPVHHGTFAAASEKEAKRRLTKEDKA